MNLPDELIVNIFTFINLNVKYFKERIQDIPESNKDNVRILEKSNIINNMGPHLFPINYESMITEKELDKILKKLLYREGKKIRTDKYVIERVCKKWYNIINNSYLKSLYESNYNIPKFKYETINYYNSLIPLPNIKPIIKNKDNYKFVYYNNYYFRNRELNE